MAVLPKSAHDHVTATYGPLASLEHTVTRAFASLPQIRHFWSSICCLAICGVGEMAWVAILFPPLPASGNSLFVPILLCSLKLHDIWVMLLMLNTHYNPFYLFHVANWSWHG